MLSWSDGRRSGNRPTRAKSRTELHEVVVRGLDGLGDEVIDDAPDVRQVA